MTMPPRQSKPEEVVMAGDGGRAPDVSEQRAVARALADLHGESPRHAMENWGNRARVAIAAYLGRADPASVLAALLAEQPDATIAALEALLTTDEVLEETAAAFSALDHSEADLPHSERSGPYEYARFMFDAACRSLRPKAPREGG